MMAKQAHRGKLPSAESPSKYSLTVHECSVSGDKMLEGVACWENY